MDQRLHIKLQNRQKEGTLRSLSCFEGYTDFFSNDYLGFSRIKYSSDSNLPKGSTGSRLISGTSAQALYAEQFIADFFETEAALIYNSGYDANLGFFSCIPQKGDIVLFDEYIHASVRDGIRLSFAEAYSFRHNDVNDLEKRLEKCKGTIYVAVESLYSMDGDMAPLKAISVLCEKYKAYLVVDEAHACGIFGEGGKGLVQRENVAKNVFARLITFGKAYGAHGACVLGEKPLIDYLINFSRSLIYTTALPPEAYQRIQQMVGHPKRMSAVKQLNDVMHYFNEKVPDTLFSPIQMLRIGNVEETRLRATSLQNKKIAVKPIFSPTVPVGREGIRVCLHSFNTAEEIDQLVMK